MLQACLCPGKCARYTCHNAHVHACRPCVVRAEILHRGGNAADAAVACAAAMAVTQPISTGLGGDAFCLYYDAAQRSVRALNGSGRSPAALTLEMIHDAGYDVNNSLPRDHGHCVTVPGAAAAWCDTVEAFGGKKVEEALQHSLKKKHYCAGQPLSLDQTDECICFVSW